MIAGPLHFGLELVARV
jgi:hypothetical protein